MTTEPDYTEDEPTGSGLRSELEKTLAEKKELQEQLAKAAADQRELAFHRADLSGADPKQLNYFQRTYDGDLTAETIRTAAIEAGIIPDMTEPAREAASAQQQMSQASAGAAEPLAPGNEQEMWAEFEKAVTVGPGEDTTTAMRRGQDVLRRHGRELGGIEDTIPSRTGNIAQTVPMSDPGWRGTPVQ